MSNHAHAASDTDFDASALIADSKRIAIIATVITVAIVGALIALVVLIAPADAPSGDMSPKGVASRIAKVGVVNLQISSAAQAVRSGEQVFVAQCGSCHTSGALGAPKLGDKGAWATRISSGFAALTKSALKGKNAMPAQTGGEFSDAEIGNAVVYMANAAGAKFAEPSVK